MQENKSFYSSDIFLTGAILILFLLFFVLIIYSIIKRNIMVNLDKFRCDPYFMQYISYFGINGESNFKYCVKNAQTEYMGQVLQPVNNSIDTLNENIYTLSDSIETIKDFTYNLRNNIGDVVNKIYNSMSNLAIQSKKIQDKNNDNMSRITGAVTNSLYLLQQNNKNLEKKFLIDSL